MRSPANMEIIQIDITNACVHNCSNCTRFCGLHPKPFFMDVETFKKAVDSLKGYKGIVGIMGGEPTLHPKFREMMDYYENHVPEKRPRTMVDYPTASFRDYVARYIYRRGRHRGLWSSMGRGYYRHFEQIQKIFPYQVLNDHLQVNQHQAILIPRKDLKIPDEEWIKLRDKCWIQNLWSASITPKGAFFCEIAASLDMLFDGPGGWPIEPDWWRRQPHEFGEQLKWCELCSAALHVPSNPANAQTDIIAESILPKLQKLNGWKIRTGHYAIFKPEDYRPETDQHDYKPTWFLPNGDETCRVSSTVSTLFPQQLDIAALNGQSVLCTRTLEQVERLDFPDFVAVFREASGISTERVDLLKRSIFNPGFFYQIGGDIMVFCRRAGVLRNLSQIQLHDRPEQHWPRSRRSRIKTIAQIAHPSILRKLCQFLAVGIHRGAFLLPEWFFPQKKW